MTTQKPEIPASPHRVNGQELLDALTSLSEDKIWGGLVTPRAFTLLEVGKRILGFDPSLGERSAEYGGKSAAGWYGQYLSMGRVRSVMLELVAEGVVTEIIGANDRAVTTAYRTGAKSRSYLLTDRYEASVAARQAGQRDLQRQKLRTEEERAFLALHAEEIQAGYEARCAAAGLSPALESTKAGRA